jgi:hypothetical protein
MRCLQKNAYDRYDSMAEIVRLIQQDWRSSLVAGHESLA